MLVACLAAAPWLLLLTSTAHAGPPKDETSYNSLTLSLAGQKTLGGLPTRLCVSRRSLPYASSAWHLPGMWG